MFKRKFRAAVSCAVQARVQSVAVVCRLLLAALSLSASAAEPAAPGDSAYQGWADAVQLGNKEVEVVAVPGIARVIHFSLRGKPNIFRVNPESAGKPADPAMEKTGAYRDFGGAKLWVAPQAKWKNLWGNWPPHYGLDSAPCAIAKLPDNTITMTGQPSPSAGVRFTRSVVAAGAAVAQEVVMENVSDQPRAWGIWTVACVRPGGLVFLPVPKGATTWSGEKDHLIPDSYGWTQHGDLLVLDHQKAKDGAKLFSISTQGWIGYLLDDQALFITCAPDPAAAYPAGEGGSEVYAAKAFIELEHVGKLEQLPPGGKATLRERWHLFPAPDAALSIDEKAAWMAAKAAELP